jgi:hypothetical protein
MIAWWQNHRTIVMNKRGNLYAVVFQTPTPPPTSGAMAKKRISKSKEFVPICLVTIAQIVLA